MRFCDGGWRHRLANFEQSSPAMQIKRCRSSSTSQITCQLHPGYRSAGMSKYLCLLVCWQALMLAPWTASASNAPAVASSNGQVKAVGTYLFPILRYGPNNQKRDLKHTLALAKALDAGVVLTGLHRHYLERPLFQNKSQSSMATCFSERVPNYLDFNEVIDRAPLESWVPVISLKDLKAKGWDGQLDAVMFTQRWWWLGRKDIRLTMQTTGFTLAPDVQHINVSKYIGCDAALIAKLKAQTTKHKFVGVMHVLLGDHERPNLNAESKPPPTDDQCEMTIYNANRLLHPAKWLSDLAQSYRDKHLGAGDYLAVHIRPYTDGCLEEWKSGLFNEAALKKRCTPELQDLHLRVGPCTKQVMASAGLKQVLVLCHPALRPVITRMYAKVNIKPLFVDQDKLTALAKCRDSSSTFLVMIEEQLAVRSHTFLGTSLSSITQTIAFERFSAGNMQNVYFEKSNCGRSLP